MPLDYHKEFLNYHVWRTPREREHHHVNIMINYLLFC